MLTTMEDLRGYFHRGKIQSSDILSIMTTLRIQLERDNQKDKYRWLNLFCNWCVHSKLSQARLSVEVFKTFYATLGNYDITQSQSTKEFYDHIFDRLRDDIKKVFVAHSVPTNLCDAENERAFCGFIIGILLIVKDRPIYLPRNLDNVLQAEVDMLPDLLKFSKGPPDFDFKPISLAIIHDDVGSFTCSLTTIGQGEGRRVIFNISPIGYKNKKLTYHVMLQE